MKNYYPLTEKEVEIYRILYYDSYKKLTKLKLEEFEIEERMKPILDNFGWSWSRFLDYKSIDLMQRLVFEYSHELVNKGIRKEPLTAKPGYEIYDPNLGALRLKDNDRSDDPDKFN